MKDALKKHAPWKLAVAIMVGLLSVQSVIYFAISGMLGGTLEV